MSLELINSLGIFVFTSYINKKVLSLKKKTISALDLYFKIILTKRLINILLVIRDKTFLIADMDYLFSRKLLVINSVLSLSLFLILI